jgi:hypothetical protein
MKAKLNICRTTMMVMVLTSMTGIIAGQGGDPSKNSNKHPRRNSTTSSASKRSSRGALARERHRREQAETEAAEARAAQARAERENRAKKNVWSVAVVRNDTGGPIPYKILRNGSWEAFTLEPGYLVRHTWLNDDCFCIKYDYKYEAGYQEKKYSLQVTSVIGHEPTESEKEKSRVNFFKLDASGDIELYSPP